MLRNVCDSCGAVIEGSPKQTEYPEAVLLVDGEDEVMYENICGECRGALKRAVSRFAEPAVACFGEPSEPQAQPCVTESEPPSAQETADDDAEIPETEAPAPQDEEADSAPSGATVERELPEAVTKRYEIKLPSHD